MIAGEVDYPVVGLDERAVGGYVGVEREHMRLLMVAARLEAIRVVDMACRADGKCFGKWSG